MGTLYSQRTNVTPLMDSCLPQSGSHTRGSNGRLQPLSLDFSPFLPLFSFLLEGTILSSNRKREKEGECQQGEGRGKERESQGGSALSLQSEAPSMTLGS